MNDGNSSHTRRSFLRISGTITGAVALVPFLTSEAARAAGMPKVEESDPKAKALQYVSDAAQAGSRLSPDQICRNCRNYEGAEEAAWGPCTIFPGKLVNANGWCAAYVARS